MARHTVGTLTSGPPPSRRAAANSASVASGRALTSPRNSRSAASSKAAAGPPERGPGAIASPASYRRNSFCTNERLTPNVAAVSSRVSPPASQACRIRTRRSSEMASMPHLRTQCIRRFLCTLT